MASYTSLGKALPDSTVVGAHSLSSAVNFPQQVSLLYGGKIAPHFGAFAQITYDVPASDTFNIDNTDFRFANAIVLPNKQPLTYGVSINNNPSVEDPYNTTRHSDSPTCRRRPPSHRWQRPWSRRGPHTR